MSADGCPPVLGRSAAPSDVLSGAARWCVAEGDALDVVRALPVACLDAVVTDPPAGVSFMGAEWDRDKGGRAQWVAWLAEVLGHARAATRDGGRALVWSLPRTSHWTGCAVEDAGWSIESTVTHLFGTGWPKGKGQLKPAAETWWLARTGRSTELNIDACRVGASEHASTPRKTSTNLFGLGPTTLDHSGHNPNVGRYPPNAVFSHAPGCRCVGERRVQSSSTNAGRGPGGYNGGLRAQTGNTGHADPDGTELVEAWECVEGCPVRELDAQSGESVSPSREWIAGRGGNTNAYGAATVRPAHGHGDTGTAARFFPQFPADEYALFGYHAKPSRAERDAGVSLDAGRHVVATGRMLNPVCLRTGTRAQHCQCGACVFDRAADPKAGNNHPTVKSIALMRWLVRLVTQPGDVVLDPFGGSGTTGVAALCEGRRVILVERDPRFAEVARQRLEHVTPDMGRPVRVAPSARAAEPGADPRQPGLFDAALTAGGV